MGSAPSSSSLGGADLPVELPDPVVAIIEGAGHIADPRVHECSLMAAEASAPGYGSRAAGAEVDRSTFLWALGRGDDQVRAALEAHGVSVERLGELAGVSPPGGLGDPYALTAELDRALRTFVAQTTGLGLTLTPWSMAVAVLQDVVTHGGPLGDRLLRIGTSAEDVLASLRALLVAGEGAEVRDELPLMRQLSPRRFGVQLPAGQETPGPYVERDVDAALRAQLRDHVPAVSLVAPQGSGAIRTMFEALMRERADDRVLLLHEWLSERADNQPLTNDLESLLPSGAEVVWVRNLGEVLAQEPALVDWFLTRGKAVAATIVTIVRPEDVTRAASLGLVVDTPLELETGLTATERARAKEGYPGEPTDIASLARARLHRSGPLRATFSADSAVAALVEDANDTLDIRADVDMLAKLIASKEVRPPLSIGLFGPWGSGKSFLMRQIQLRIADLAEKSRDAGGSQTGYHREIVPVEFNAWQYAHGEALWASLINRVFEQVREHLGGDERYQGMLQDLADKDQVVAQARRRLNAAQAEVTRTTSAAGDRVIREVADDHDISRRSTEQIESAFDVEVATAQVSQLRAEYERMRTVGSRLRKGWSIATGRRKAVVVALAVAALVAAAFYLLDPSAVTAVRTLLVATAPVVAMAVAVLRPVNLGLEQAARILRADDADKEQLRRAQEDLVRATESLAAARTSGLAGLYGFVSERSSAAEYRQHLGMAPMIRDDLKRLADKSRQAEGLPGIDRIVIFIDDLDRCPAAEVVRVLEAVNLLFGFELFAVVVAVDSRWLMRSLLTNFADAFDGADPSAPTPQNYLEKIIQIPFWVQPMRSEGFGALVRTLAGDVDDRTPPEEAAFGHQPLEAHPTGALARQTAAPVRDGGDRAVRDDHGRAGSPPAVAGVDPATEAHDQPSAGARSASDDLNPAALRLTTDERELMMRFLPLLDTPRAVKRFLNTYQLLRVSVADVDSFLDRREYEPVLVLLALMTGTVPLSDAMVEELRGMEEVDFGLFLATVGSRAPSLDPTTGVESSPYRWEAVKSACAQLPTDSLTPAVIDEWLPRVARYSFHPIT